MGSHEAGWDSRVAIVVITCCAANQKEGGRAVCCAVGFLRVAGAIYSACICPMAG